MNTRRAFIGSAFGVVASVALARSALSAFMTGEYRDGHEIEMPLVANGWRTPAGSGARVTFTVRNEMMAGGRPCQSLVSCGMTVARKFCYG